VQELFADLDRLRSELELKADEVEEGRRRLAERGRQLADQRKEVGRLSHQIEQQVTATPRRRASAHARALDRERNQAQEHEALQTTAAATSGAKANANCGGTARHCKPKLLPVARGGAGVITPPCELAELRRHCEALQQAAAATTAATRQRRRRRRSWATNRTAATRAQRPSCPARRPGRGRAERSSSGLIAYRPKGRAYLASEKEQAELEAGLSCLTGWKRKRRSPSRNANWPEQGEQSELKAAGQLIEQQSDLMAAGMIRASVGAHDGPGPAVTLFALAVDDTLTAADPVVSSVMAQFARFKGRRPATSE
jgi:hypothetical protein